MESIKTCPSCGGAKVKKLRRKWTGEYKGRPYSVEDLEFHECPDCGERIFGREAMRRIEANSPAFAKVVTRK